MNAIGSTRMILKSGGSIVFFSSCFFHSKSWDVWWGYVVVKCFGEWWSIYKKIKSCMPLLWILRKHTIGLREAVWSVLRIYGVGGQLLKGIQAFYRDGGTRGERNRKDGEI